MKALSSVLSSFWGILTIWLKPLLNIYINDTSVYGCRSKNLSNQRQAANLPFYLTQWIRDQILTFITVEFLLVKFHHHRADPEYSPDIMIIRTLNIALKMHCIPIHPRPQIDLLYKIHRQSSGKRVAFCYFFRKHLSPPVIPYLQESVQSNK